MGSENRPPQPPTQPPVRHLRGPAHVRTTPQKAHRLQRPSEGSAPDAAREGPTGGLSPDGMSHGGAGVRTKVGSLGCSSDRAAVTSQGVSCGFLGGGGGPPKWGRRGRPLLGWRRHSPPPPPHTPSTARATAPSLGPPTPGVVKQDKSSGGSVDTTKTRSDP